MIKYPIRVLHVGMCSNYGGVESFVLNVYRNIDRDLVQFDFTNVYTDGSKIAYQDEIESLGGRIFHWDVNRKKHLFDYKQRLKYYLREAAKDVQIIHKHIQNPAENMDPLRFAKKCGFSARILHAHNTAFPGRLNYYSEYNLLKNKLDFNKLAESYLACSEEAGRFNFGKIPFTVYRNAIDVKKFRFDPEVRMRKKGELHIDGVSFVLLFVGHFSYQKNPLFAVQVFYELLKKRPDSVFLMVGLGKLEEDVRRLCNELGIADKVRLLGRRLDVNELMQASDMLLFPSRYEGLGIVLIEAQTSGLPCVVAQHNVPTSSNLTGLVEYVSLDSSYACWVERILATRETRKDRSAEIVACGYDVCENARIMSELYMRLASQNGAL